MSPPLPRVGRFPANADVPNIWGTTRNQAINDVLPLMRDLAKFTNNLGVQFAGPSSNPVHQRNINEIRALFEKWNISARRIDDAVTVLEGAP